jgi:hypothetical protein
MLRVASVDKYDEVSTDSPTGNDISTIELCDTIVAKSDYMEKVMPTSTKI